MMNKPIYRMSGGTLIKKGLTREQAIEEVEHKLRVMLPSSILERIYYEV